jgi:hypothetical protein
VPPTSEAQGPGVGVTLPAYLSEPQLRFLFLFRASRILVRCCAAVANNIGGLLEADIDALILGLCPA